MRLPTFLTALAAELATLLTAEATELVTTELAAVLIVELILAETGTPSCPPPNKSLGKATKPIKATAKTAAGANDFPAVNGAATRHATNICVNHPT